MKLPEKLRIGIHDYKVNYTKKQISVDGVICLGFNDGESKEILVCTKDKKEIPYILTHELIHGVCLESGFRQATSWSMDLEELICEQVTQMLLANFELRPKPKKK